MKKTLLILSFILLSVVSFAQRQRTTAVFDSDTTTRPKAGFYGIGVRANNIYFVPPAGNNIRLANYSLFTGLTTNYLTKWDGSKFIPSNIYEDGTFFSSNVPNFLIGGSFPIIKFNGSQAGSIVYDLRSYIGGVSNGGFEIYDNTNSHTRFTITPTGNVGIGTSSPSAKLDVVGNIKVPFQSNAYIGSSLINCLLLDGSGNFDINLLSTSGLGLIFESDGGTTKNFFIGTGDGDPDSATKLFTILQSGNVGIGTSTPTSKLQVVGLPTYADNAAAITGGLTAGAFYRTVLGVLMVVY